MLKDTAGQKTQQRYDHRVVDWLFDKWGMDKTLFGLNKAG